MSHTIYTTPAIIISAQYHGKANRRFTVLTRDLGLLSVQAQGVRELASKLRFHMQIFNHCEIDCLQGKEGWRLVGAHPRYDISAPSPAFQPLYARLFRLIRRLVMGEETTQPELYDWLCELYIFTNSLTITLTTNQLVTLEIVALAKIMHILGYLDNEHITDIALDLHTLDTFSHERKSLILMINESLSASQL